MASIQFNGQSYDHNSLRIGCFNNTMMKDLCASLDYSHGFTVGDSYGTHPVPLPTGMGKYKAQGSIGVYQEAWQNLIQQLPDGYLALPPFPIVASYKARGGPLHTIEMRECRFLMEKGGSRAESSGGIVITIDLYIREIWVNGKSPYAQIDE